MKILQYLRRLLRWFYRKRLKNTTFSLITNNCVGGIISHDMHLQFRSPTINLFFNNDEFVLFLEHLQYYLALDLVPVETDKSYPVGKLCGEFGDVVIYFMHYGSFVEAKAKWESRKDRIDYNNIFIVMESQKCDKEIVERFARLPFKNKVVITDKAYADIKCSIPMKEGFYDDGYYSGKILAYPKFGLKRYLDRFDYVSFFNSGVIRKRLL